jgi:PAS domain S-box-containing protein
MSCAVAEEERHGQNRDRADRHRMSVRRRGAYRHQDGPQGHITYANDVFLRLSKYPLREVLGAPHSLIRHPDMPRCVFKLLWDTIEAKKEIFAYVLNMARDGNHYWVFAHVTPTLDAEQKIVGYHSNRRRIPETRLQRA